MSANSFFMEFMTKILKVAAFSLEMIKLFKMGTFVKINKDLFFNNLKEIILKIQSNLKLKEVVLPNDSKITSIENYAFADSSLTEFNFQNLKELSKIGDGAFTNTLLREINLSNSEKITTIGKGAFYGITSNPSLELGNKSNITSVGEQAFCQTQFIYSGYTNINESLTSDELTNSCLADIIN